MEKSLEQTFLAFSTAKRRQYSAEIVGYLDLLSEDKLRLRGGANENAIGNLAAGLSRKDVAVLESIYHMDTHFAGEKYA